MDKQAHQKTMSPFLCQKHRQAFISQPEYAESVWKRLIIEAQGQVCQYEWKKALIIYGNAFEISDILLKKTNENHAIKRYLRTAIEFAYVLRQCTYNADVSALVTYVTDTLTEHLYPAECQLILQPLNNVAFSTLHEPKSWMNILQYMSDSYAKTIH